MVSRKTYQGPALILIIWVLLLGASFGANAMIYARTDINEKDNAFIVKNGHFDTIDFTPTIDQWVTENEGKKSIIIYDLDRDELSYAYNQNEQFNMASLYKLFVVYEGYRKIGHGEWNYNDQVASHTKEECLDLAIRESDSSCAEALYEQIGENALQDIVVNEFGITNTYLPDYVSDAEGILEIMKLYFKHPDFSSSTVAKIEDSMLNQPVTTSNWRQGLPSGFSDAVNVYDKVGWMGDGENWSVYHDAAILEVPKTNRHFIVVVLTSGINHRKIAELGTRIEKLLLP